MVDFILGNKYIIVFDINGSILTYVCSILNDTEKFVTFTDKNNKTISYNKDWIISYEEVRE